MSDPYQDLSRGTRFTQHGELIVMVGLPGSGKTTKASRIKELFGDDVVILSRDAFREQFGCWPAGSPKEELAITTIIDTSSVQLLKLGAIVVIDATNLGTGDRRHWAAIASIAGVDVPVRFVDLTGVKIEQCIANDQERRDAGGQYVGPEVIRAMAEQSGMIKVDERPTMLREGDDILIECPKCGFERHVCDHNEAVGIAQQHVCE